MTKFITLDPRNILAATEANDKVFASGPVYGVEVTVPALAARCVENLDPQHTGGDATRAAIEAAAEVDLPENDVTFATVKADLDAVGAMAVFHLRMKGEIPAFVWKAGGVVSLRDGGNMRDWSEFVDRVYTVAKADAFTRGGWPGVKALPTTDNPWPSSGLVDATRELAAMAKAVEDFKVPLAGRVAMMEHWLLTGVEPKSYRESVERERLSMINALEEGQVMHEVRANGRIAVVESMHRAATEVGYSLAPVVVALNPAFKLGAGEPHRKFTICAFEARFADVRAALAELATLETGWGGSPTIGGSPQGVNSTLTVDQVVAVVEKHLRG